MFKSKYDIYFVFCISFMIIISIYLGFQHTQQESLDEYLLLIRDKISSMIPDEKDRQEFEILFSNFVNGVENNSVSANEVEKLAENIIELRKEKTILTKDDLNELLPSYNSDFKVQVNPIVFNFKNFKMKDWKKLTLNFEKSYLQCDSIRIKNKQAKKLYKQLKKQIEIHARISEKHRQKSEALKDKLKKIENVDVDTEMEKMLLGEIEKLKMENEKIYSKISSLNEMQMVIDKEREKLQQEMQYIDSLQSVKL